MNNLFRSVAVVFLFASPWTYAAATDSSSSVDSRSELLVARLMQENGRPDMACGLLADTPANSVDADRLYVLARCNASLQRITAAITYYQRVIALQPQEANPRVELAAIMVAMDRRDEAAQLYKETLPLLPAGQVSTQMNNLIEQLGRDDPAAFARQASGKPWSIEVFTGIVHDSNINGGPISNIVSVLGIPGNFILDGSAMPKSSWGATGSVTGSYILPLNERWSVLFQGALLGNGYFDTSDFNNEYMSLSAAFIYRDKNWSASIQPNVSFSRQANRMNEMTPGVIARFSRNLSQILSLTGSLGYINRTVHLDNNRNADGVLGSVGLVAQLLPNLQVGGEYNLQREHADIDAFSRRVHGPSVFAAYRFNPQWTIVGNYSYSNVKYDQGVDSLLGTFPAREDTQKTASLTTLWDISPWAGRNMVVRAQYTQIDNPSNIGYSNYTRNIFSLGVQTQF
ncbi:MAG: surface lipoprotein assembly modifier [Pseudomonadota bacterium]